jgi:hypothetical protein
MMTEFETAQIVIFNSLYAVTIGAAMFQMTTSAIAAAGFLQKFYEVSGYTETPIVYTASGSIERRAELPSNQEKHE